MSSIEKEMVLRNPTLQERVPEHSVLFSVIFLDRVVDSQVA
jgi:hypothetical protein